MKKALMGNLLAFFSLAATHARAAENCGGLMSLKIPETAILAVQTLAPGAYLPPGEKPSAAVLAVYKSLPSFCRVQGVIQSTGDSRIEFEVWMPVADWNGRYLGVGNGGFAGSIDYGATPNPLPGLAEGLANGYAASSTDTGHKGEGNSIDWAAGHPARQNDYWYRAIHETAQKSKVIIRAFYGTDPKYSYFDSCSSGGRQSMVEAQRWPADYDGYLAGAPSFNRTANQIEFVWVARALEAPGSYIPPAKLPAIEAAALNACDATDGLKDGLIDDPRKCHFNPAVLLCKGAESDSCLSQPQVAALRKIYDGPRNSRGEQIFPGYVPGGETGGRTGWEAAITGSGPGLGQATTRSEGFFEIFVNPGLNYRKFDFDRDVKLLEEKLAPSANATETNLVGLKNRGGKMIIFHGWSDPFNPPQATVDYYNSVVSTMGAKDAADVLRLYMVPGMHHCYGGPGPNVFGSAPDSKADSQHNMLTALESWVERGISPGEIVARKYKTDGDLSSGVVRTRPLCPFPQVARYKGSGSIDDASNFTCAGPR